MTDFRLVDLLMLAAVFLGPIAAVRITRLLDDRKEFRSRRLELYRVLMATRADMLADAHIKALNSIDLEFSSRKKADTRVRIAWKEYLDLLSDRSMTPENWNVRRVDLLVELLYAMGTALGYDFDRVHIKNGVYSPAAHGTTLSEQAGIRRGIRDLVEGRKALPIYMVNPATSPNPEEQLTKIPPVGEPQTA